jgi:hypothetical protein
VLVAGQIALQVVNPDGETSNTVALDVASDPSVLSISSISPDSGMVGAQVTVTGVGFTPTGNMIQMANVLVPTLRGVTGPIASADGRTLTFNVPVGICPPCAFSTPPCLAPCFAVRPGSYHISVTNSNGLSNSLLFVVSGPISIASVSPDVGPIGVQVTVTGTGFTSDANIVELVKLSDPAVGGLIGRLPSPDGKTLTFTVPESLLPLCFFNGCRIANTPVSAGSYLLSVSNANGLSNSLGFLVSSASGPIGVWGSSGDKVKATVTDTQVTVDGSCFTGLVPETLVADAMGNFKLDGSFTTLVGPGAVLQAAQYSGSINGVTMALSITTASQKLGPFTLTFGNEVPVGHLCV